MPDDGASQKPAEPGLPPVVTEPPVPEMKWPDRAVSQSGLFRVMGGHAEERGAVVLALEEWKNRLERLFAEQQPEQWKVPISVILEGKSGDPPKPRSISYDLTTDGRNFTLTLRIHLARGVDQAQLSRAAVTLLLYERSLRKASPEMLEGGLFVRPWLIEGLLEAQSAADGKLDRALYQGVAATGGGFTANELFEMPETKWRQLDGASRLAFQALSGAMVMALLDQPDGRTAFSRMTSEVARFGGETSSLLHKYFPDLNLSERSLAKWWQLKLATLGDNQLINRLTIAKTEDGIREALRFRYEDADGIAQVCDLSGWEKLIALPAEKRATCVKPAEEALVHLSYRCFPSYSGLLADYLKILGQIRMGKSSKLAEQILVLDEERALRLKRAIRARDYLDFIEISEARDVSGSFEDYLKLVDELKERPRDQRDDSFSKMLDRMDAIYIKKEKR
jgi:hypothetical protein